MVFLQVSLRGRVDRHAKARLEEEEEQIEPSSAARASHALPFPGGSDGGRIATNMLWTLIKCAAPPDLLAVLYSAPHEGHSDLGIGPKHLIHILTEAYCTTEVEINRHYEQFSIVSCRLIGPVNKKTFRFIGIGRSGACCASKGFISDHNSQSASLDSCQSPRNISAYCEGPIHGLPGILFFIFREFGKNSKKKKTNHVRAILVAARDCEPKYLIRLLLKDKLRIGPSELSLLEALACAAAYAKNSSKSHQSDLSKAIDILKGVHSMVPVYDKILPALLDGGVWNLAETCSFSLGIPCEPMLLLQLNQCRRL
ncbi:hypothetical protein Cgig2_015011 [Carnegiea gigantea]|uniref:DNA ligase ATP-dependent N-terminal domain-containing protein n=1 Tax=Carnegiea gigantea TaxID=171969 RepID=A0A9Q1GKX1_9CARY|nr:hypothetical protein Cgig2_015011 [Carnegiea gigantea]